MNNPGMYEDELDLRVIARTLWKYRILVLGLPLFSALLVFAISLWVLPKKYRAVVYVTITPPSIKYATVEGINISPISPDLRAITEMARSDPIIQQVKFELRISANIPPGENQWKPAFQVYSIGNSLIRLEVTDTDAQRAAQFVNLWAEKIADWIEDTYGVKGILDEIVNKEGQTYFLYREAQNEYVEFLLSSPHSILQSRLDALIKQYGCLESQEMALGSIEQQLSVLKERIDESNAAIAPDIELIVRSLEESLLGTSICGLRETGQIVLVSSTTFDGEQNQTVKERIETLLLATQKLANHVANEKTEIGEQILLLQADAKRAEFQELQMRLDLNAWQKIYLDLSYQRALIREITGETSEMARINTPANIPENPVSPKPLFNAVVAAVTVGVVVSGFVLLRETWFVKK